MGDGHENQAVATRAHGILSVYAPEEVEVIRNTVCKEATDAEMKLYFYDCSRNKVHPLDRLIHFTKRKGRYVPITSIDFFRMRAGDTQEHMGTDDPEFNGPPKSDNFSATVTVYRWVKGIKCAFTGTARWPEYKPDEDFMWKKMPHTMLAKCAEALALRKAFPKELHGLYTKDEMEQVENDKQPLQEKCTLKDTEVIDAAGVHYPYGEPAQGGDGSPARLADPPAPLPSSPEPNNEEAVSPFAEPDHPPEMEVAFREHGEAVGAAGTLRACYKAYKDAEKDKRLSFAQKRLLHEQYEARMKDEGWSWEKK